jgi:hypothetical protein
VSRLDRFRQRRRRERRRKKVEDFNRAIVKRLCGDKRGTGLSRLIEGYLNDGAVHLHLKGHIVRECGEAPRVNLCARLDRAEAVMLGEATIVWELWHGGEPAALHLSVRRWNASANGITAPSLNLDQPRGWRTASGLR